MSNQYISPLILFVCLLMSKIFLHSRFGKSLNLKKEKEIGMANHFVVIWFSSVLFIYNYGM